MATVVASPRLAAFLDALPSATPNQFVSPPGLGGTWRARFIRAGLDKGVVAVHWTGLGLCIVQPPTHGVCRECASQKGNDCQHCACAMCAWFRMTDERASPKVSREKMMQLALRMKAFQMAKPATVAMLDDELLSD